VFAAVSTTNALNEIKAQFTKDTGAAVETSFAASSTLAQQVINGAEADLFISADTMWADYLAKKDLVGRQQDLLGNRLVIVVPADSKIEVNKPEDLLAASIKHLALGEPQSVPAGIYAKGSTYSVITAPARRVAASEAASVWLTLRPRRARTCSTAAVPECFPKTNSVSRWPTVSARNGS